MRSLAFLDQQRQKCVGEAHEADSLRNNGRNAVDEVPQTRLFGKSAVVEPTKARILENIKLRDQSRSPHSN
ncbi:hypothetical protein AMQ84_18400 [Paenibacillus riograndensis]|uniref:Uncharacterized protein n=1 Tax=Paenibacillus riograndensis TaxID=483937 RepID=A0A132TVR9_9BACL|nr:hypothetical protein AMQ84_18400 [Paenibacillus riograndensis]